MTIVSVILSYVNATVVCVVTELVGIAEIAELLGVTRQRVDAIVRTHAGFPKPVADLRAGRIWRRKDVELWARREGRIK